MSLIFSMFFFYASIASADWQVTPIREVDSHSIIVRSGFNVVLLSGGIQKIEDTVLSREKDKFRAISFFDEKCLEFVETTNWPSGCMEALEAMKGICTSDRCHESTVFYSAVTHPEHKPNIVKFESTFPEVDIATISCESQQGLPSWNGEGIRTWSYVDSPFLGPVSFNCPELAVNAEVFYTSTTENGGPYMLGYGKANLVRGITTDQHSEEFIFIDLMGY
jgi:hypothetical protein